VVKSFTDFLSSRQHLPEDFADDYQDECFDLIRLALSASRQAKPESGTALEAGEMEADQQEEADSDLDLAKKIMVSISWPLGQSWQARDHRHRGTTS
jgi:hypothetical protein